MLEKLGPALTPPAVRPARSYEEALERVRALQALDDASILPEAYTKLYDHGSRTPLAVVLLHGLTNHPGQYAQFAPQVHQRGANVLVPRLPEQGDRNRMTTRLAKLTAEDLLASATEAIDIAQGLGERVCVAGISTSGLLCAYFAQYRSDVARSIPVNPVFALLHFPYVVSRLIEEVLLRIPNFFLWWDPRYRMKELPATGYPRFPTHALAQALRIGDAVYAEARRNAMLAQSVVVVTNKRDPAVNNAATQQVMRAWGRLAPGRVTAHEFTTLPVNHDILDPQNSQPRVDIVYPALLSIVAEAPALT
jgi:alpha-beta hydrolase superfamily lysophospholipase